MSAPEFLITSCGAVTLPSDFDILRPSSSSTKPCVSTTSNGATPRVPQLSEQRGLEPAAMLVGAFEIHDGVRAAVLLALDAGEAREMLRRLPARRRASSRSRTRHRGCRRPSASPRWQAGRENARARPAHTRRRRPPASKASAMRLLTRSSSRMSTEPSPFSRTNTVIGTPQARCREITQSGLLMTMPLMRFSPCGGTQRVSLMAASARSRSVSPGLALPSPQSACPSR